ncbi:hypothetical protein [Candidatus Nanohalobium constans]|uniref:Uncharacterized protein n=1 Tax=Candidatus Nanohalobium constans TaxID=2565781 RepID=A0A5Q0UHF9_9ARCH|nr:hypothetical protein [Candidatus Nanohalobium constans]QGA80385.1 hypothetical protein LC1Nh_0485 [Candidatus Nanohalobium constans]
MAVWKGQSSIEYLANYGWMVVAVALISGTVYTQIPDPCNLEPQSLGTRDVKISEMGITTSQELALSLQSMVAEEVVIDQIIIEGNETLYNNQSKALYRSSEPFNLGGATKTEECNDFTFTVVYDRAEVPNIKQTTDIRLPVQLDSIQIPYLLIGGGEISSLESNSTFRATNSDICLGGNCGDSGPTDDNRVREYVNRSGDEMTGALETNSVEWGCIGGNCGVEEGSLEGYVSEENNTVDGTLNLTEIKPDNNLCMGQTC